MGGENVEQFRLEIEDGGATEKANTAAAGMDRLADSIDRMSGAAMRTTAASAEQSVAINGLVEQMKKSQDAAKGSAGAHREMAEGFSKAKHEGREFAKMADHLTGVNTGLSGIIRGAINPEFLAMAAAALVVGKAIEFLAEGSKELNEELKKSSDQYLSVGKGLEEMAAKGMKMNHAQMESLRIAREVKAEREAEEWTKKGQAIESAEKHIAIWNGVAGTANVLGLGMVKTWKDGEIPQQNWIVRHTLLGVAMNSVNEHLKELHENEKKMQDRMQDAATATQNQADQMKRYDDLLKAGASALKSMQSPQEHWTQNLAIALPLLNGTVEGLARYAQAMGAALNVLKKENEEAGKKGADALNQRQEFYKSLTAMEAKGEKDSISRKMATLDAERTAEINTAKKVLHTRQELQNAIQRINAATLKQKQIELDAETTADRKHTAEIGKELKKRWAQLHQENQKEFEDTIKFATDTEARRGLIGKKGMALKLAQLEGEIKKEKADVAAWLKLHQGMEKVAQDRLTVIDAEAAAARKQIAHDEQMAKVGYALGAAGAMASVAGSLFENNKAVASIAAAINTAQAATAAMTGPPPMPYAAVFVAMAIAEGVMQIAKINSAKAPTFTTPAVSDIGQAHSGMVFPSSGSFLMNVQAGEVIMPNTSELTSISDSITKIAAGAGEGGGGLHLHMNAPWYGGAGAVRDVVREGGKVKRQLTAARRRE